MRTRILTVLGIMLSLWATAQPQVEMADGLRSSGKIYAVVAVCLAILLGLLLYVWNVDRKISKLEKEKK